ncbi:MAG: aldo/keto reductase [Hyphomonadaceae bacterium]|nr:aldo/keto reductase [Hyphomonadaceae bacterium]
MEKRRLGRSGIEIAPLMLGGNVFGNNVDQAGTNAILDAFVDLGGNAIDTADAYSFWVSGHTGGESETAIGHWIRTSGKRERVIIATKVGMLPSRAGLKRANIEAGVEESLRRLQTDRIDLYQSHRDDTETPQEESLAAFDALVKAGKVRFIGASNFTAERLDEALKTSGAKGLARYETLQPHYNLMHRDLEADLQPLCVRENVSIISYFSLASGFLTGKYRSAADKGKSGRGAGMDRYLNEKGFRVLAALDAVSARRGATQAQVALAWLMAKPAVAAPIASATSVTQLRDIMGALTLKLDAADITELDAASA